MSDFVSARRFRNRLLLVSDSAGWVIQSVSTILHANLPSELKPLVVTNNIHRARNCTIHFINRLWAWSDDFLETISPSNRLIGLWWHGRRHSNDPETQTSLDRLISEHSRFDLIQVTCTPGLETLLEIGVPEEKTVLLPMGVDLKSFHHAVPLAERTQLRDRLGVPSNASVIGCFQKDGEGWEDGMEPKWIKGPDILANVLENINQHHPIFVVIPGPARGYLKERLNQAGVPYAAPGLISTDELRKLYCVLDIYISPSRDEGGPAGALECMASGIPLVSTRTGMPVDMIENGENGLIVDVEDVDGLVACVSELIDKPSFRERLSGNALRTIQAYDWPVISQRYIDELYLPVISTKRS